MSTTTINRKILAASFETSDGASRAAGAVLSAYSDRVFNTAVVHVRANGTAHFVESKDWGPGRGALLGGAIGLIGGPLGVLVGGGIGVFATKLRDKGFKDSQLRELGNSLGHDESVVMPEIAADATHAAAAMLALTARSVVTEHVDANVAALFDEESRFVIITEPTR